MAENNFNLDAATGAGDRAAPAQATRASRALERQMRLTGSAATDAAARQGRLEEATQRSAEASRRATTSLKPLHAAISVGAVAHLGRSIIGAAASFEQLQLRLRAFEGSAEAASARFDQLLGYAAQTPFALADVVNAFVRLQATGFTPDLGALRSLGDIAAASGRQLGELADAIAVMGQGEFAAIESFGFDVREQGDEAPIAFRDTAPTVETSRTAILSAFADIGAAPDRTLPARGRAARNPARRSSMTASGSLPAPRPGAEVGEAMFAFDRPKRTMRGAGCGANRARRRSARATRRAGACGVDGVQRTKTKSRMTIPTKIHAAAQIASKATPPATAPLNAATTISLKVEGRRIITYSSGSRSLERSSPRRNFSLYFMSGR